MSKRLMRRLISVFTCTISTMTVMKEKSYTNYAGSLQEEIADTWREKFSNVNVVMRNVNISI